MTAEIEPCFAASGMSVIGRLEFWLIDDGQRIALEPLEPDEDGHHDVRTVIRSTDGSDRSLAERSEVLDRCLDELHERYGVPADAPAIQGRPLPVERRAAIMACLRDADVLRHFSSIEISQTEDGMAGVEGLHPPGLSDAEMNALSQRVGACVLEDAERGP